MPTSSKHYTITEYESFTLASGKHALPARVFEALEGFVLANRGSGTDTLELLSISARKGVGKVITAKNYVGVITTNDGTVIEILPKIYGETSYAEVRSIFLDMLKTVRDIPSKDFNVSRLKAERCNLFEIFIRMFVAEVTALVKQGLKSSYLAVEENQPYFKGKLLVPLQIKHNLADKSKFYMRYDEFSLNRAENRLLKSTLKYLHGISSDNANKLDIKRLLAAFDEVDCSANVDADFDLCLSNRSMNHYQKALGWAKVFLRKKSFSAFSGSDVAIALLFPMNVVFESYVAARIRRSATSGVTVRTQNVGRYLFDKPRREFALKPDVLVERAAGREINTYVLDTKWKLLNVHKPHLGISQSDMYQMYAYGKKYAAKTVTLIYPMSENTPSTTSFTSNDGVVVQVMCVDLRRHQITTSMEAILKHIV